MGNKAVRLGLGLGMFVAVVSSAAPLGRAADREIAANRQRAEAMFSAAASAALPFSFVYGGRPSASFIGSWASRVEDRAVDVGKRLRILTITDPTTGLEIRAFCTVYLDSAGLDWTLAFTNKGTVDTPVIEQLQALDVSIKPGPGPAPIWHGLKGSRCADDDWQPFARALISGAKYEFGAENGRSSADSPFFNIQYGGGGVVTAVGWSGQWRGLIEAPAANGLRIAVHQQNLHTVLHPGESLRSPRILQLYWFGDDPDRACNLFRRTMLAHIVPHIDGRPITPPIAHLSTSFYEMNDSTEANVTAHLNAAKGLGFEVFWLDAYWTKKGFPEGMGNYGFPITMAEPADRFPRGLKPISDAAHAAGMKFLVWFEPERVAAGTYLAESHPDWVVGGAKGGLFNLGNDEARAHMTAYLKAVIAAYGMDWLRIDYNIDPLPYWKALDKDPNRGGMGEMRYIQGLYRMWDDLRTAFPRLMIDDCASGGRRIDLETMSRALPLWRSDNTCNMTDLKAVTVRAAATKNQLMSAGLNRYVPFSTCGQMGSDPYLFRSGFNGGISFAEDTRPADYPRAELAKGIAEGKRLRPYWFGDFYPLSPVTLKATDWCVMQYHRPAEGDGIVIAFRREQAASDFTVSPREIDPDGRFAVTWSYGYEVSERRILRGSELKQLRLHIDSLPGSVVVEYKKQ
ncbi:MAG: alpha-galactosidase [Candidatus Aminicenantes bacterium]|nr:alpha-galactosidase [Candidatus Aminicenantes bacterium]